MDFLSKKLYLPDIEKAVERIEGKINHLSVPEEKALVLNSFQEVIQGVRCSVEELYETENPLTRKEWSKLSFSVSSLEGHINFR